MNSYIIDFFDNVTFDQIITFMLSIEGEIVDTFVNYPNTFLVNANKDVTPNQFVERVIVNDSLTYSLQSVVDLVPLAPSSTLELNVNDENWSRVFSLKDGDISLPYITIPIWGEYTGIYLIDSGIKSDLNEFSNKNIVQLHSFNDSFTDTIGHGTAMASVIVGEQCGLTSSTVKNVKVFDNNTTTKPSDLLKAFDAILTDFLSLMPRIFHVVNFSWIIPKNSFIENKIQKLYDNGLALVSAVGSLGQDANQFSPCSMSNVLSIGAYNQNLEPCDFTTSEDIANNISRKLNFNKIDSWAPGNDVKVAGLDGEYYQLSGSSISAAIYSASLVYNQSQSLFNRIPMRGNYTREGKYFYEYWLRLERQDVLDLFNNDYSNITNTVCTFRNTSSVFDPINIPYSSKTIPCIPGMRIPYMFYNPRFTTSYEILGTLPEGCSIEREYIWFEPTRHITEDILITIKINVVNDPRPFILEITYESYSEQMISQQGLIVSSSNLPVNKPSSTTSSGVPAWDCVPNCGWWCFQEAGCQFIGVKTCQCA